MTSTQYKTNKRLSRSKLRPTRGLSSARRRQGEERAGGGSADAGGGEGRELRARPRSLSVCSSAAGESGTTPNPHPKQHHLETSSSARPRRPPVPARGSGMPASMFSIDNILATRPRCKDSVLPVAPSAAAPVVFPALHGDSLYGAGGGTSSDYGAFYPRPVAPGGAGLPATVGGSRLGYNSYFYGQLHVQAAPVGPACCGAVPPLGAQQCSCVPTPPGRVAIACGPSSQWQSVAAGCGRAVLFALFTWHQLFPLQAFSSLPFTYYCFVVTEYGTLHTSAADFRLELNRATWTESHGDSTRARARIK